MVPCSNSLKRHVVSIFDKCSNLRHLEQLQAHLITLGHGNSHFYTFKLIRFCTVPVSTNNLGYARHLFDKFPSPNIYLYTAIISAYASVPDHESAVLLYRDMVRENRSKPNHFMFSTILKPWSEVARSHGVELVQAQIVKSGYGGNTVVQTAILDAYSRHNDKVSLARKVFDEMPERTVISWTAMISGYARAGQVGSAVLMFEEMPEGIRDTPFWNCIISGCVKNGFFSEAIEFFKRMVAEECVVEVKSKPNEVTIVCVLSALGHSGMLQAGRCIHGYIFRNKLDSDSDSSVAIGLVDMYGKCGCLEKSRTVFNNSIKVRNLTSWNCLINCYALHGRCHEAIDIFEGMKLKLNPDGVTFVGLLNACTHGGLVDEGLLYYDMMIRKYEIEPEIEHYGCLVDLLSRSGRFEEAMEVVEGMRIPPDEGVWSSLLNGCRIHRRVDLAEFAVRKLVEMCPDDGGYSAVLANLYGDIGKWDEARRVRKMMLEGNVWKAAGCSWVEVEDRVHEFYCADRRHSRMEEIYAVLEGLADAYKIQYGIAGVFIELD